MPLADAPPGFADRLASLVAEAAADARPPSLLLARLQALDSLDAEGGADAAALGAALFESIHYRLPAFPDDELPLVASGLYAREGRDDAAFLLAALAVQLRPGHEPAQEALRARQAVLAAATDPPNPEIAAKAEVILGAPEPAQPLLLALEALDTEAGRAASAALFEAVWPRVQPMSQYWVYHRMSQVYHALGRADATMVMATLAIQVEPFALATDMPYRFLLGFFRDAGRLRDAAELCVRRHALCPEPHLLDERDLQELLDQAGILLLSPPPAGRQDRPLREAEIRRTRPWRCYGEGVPVSLVQLQRDMKREPISIAELRDAEVLIDHGAVAVFGADGAPHIDLSLRCFPPLLRRALSGAAHGGVTVDPYATDEITIAAAVLISDEFPGPNLCHFLLDHASRLELYRDAGIEIAEVTVIGPELRHEYQRDTMGRLRVHNYVPVNRRARLRVSQLWVSSTCRALRHPAHWAAEWAIRSVRDKFDLAPRRPARRLLISRRDSPWRRIRNEARIAHLLEPLGFEVIVPGSLSFAEQIAAFRDATHVIGPHGAGLANILWCAPGTHVLEIFHPHYGTWAYAMLNDALDIDYASMVGRDADSGAPEFNDPTLPREQTVPHSGRDILVDTDELERWLIDSEAF